MEALQKAHRVCYFQQSLSGSVPLQVEPPPARCPRLECGFFDGEGDPASLIVYFQDQDIHLIPFLKNLAGMGDTFIADLRNMDQAIHSRGHFNKGTEISQPGDLPMK